MCYSQIFEKKTAIHGDLPHLRVKKNKTPRTEFRSEKFYFAAGMKATGIAGIQRRFSRPLYNRVFAPLDSFSFPGLDSNVTGRSNFKHLLGRLHWRISFERYWATYPGVGLESSYFGKRYWRNRKGHFVRRTGEFNNNLRSPVQTLLIRGGITLSTVPPAFIFDYL